MINKNDRLNYCCLLSFQWLKRPFRSIELIEVAIPLPKSLSHRSSPVFFDMQLEEIYSDNFITKKTKYLS